MRRGDEIRDDQRYFLVAKLHEKTLFSFIVSGQTHWWWPQRPRSSRFLDVVMDHIGIENNFSRGSLQSACLDLSLPNREVTMKLMKVVRDEVCVLWEIWSEIMVECYENRSHHYVLTQMRCIWWSRGQTISTSTLGREDRMGNVMTPRLLFV